MSSVDDLSSRIAFVRDGIERNVKASAATDAGRLSGFWADMFAGRRNWPDLNEISVFRREGFTSGIGDEPPSGYRQERERSARIHHIFRRMVSPQFVAGLPEPTFGAPLFFEHDNVLRSVSYWINAGTSKRVLELLDLHGPRRPLRILEIGAGWGGCLLQLHHALDVESCLIVDLPENLYLSTIYLGTVIPGRGLRILDVAGEPMTQIERGSISASLPGAIGRIRSRFDLVINSFSLQEMDLESVRSYIDWIATVLSDDGIFVSLNSHAKAGVRKPSDYGYERFHIHHWGVFRRSPTGYFNTIPYEVVVGRRRADSPSYSATCQDALGCLMQLGLDCDLTELCRAFTSGPLDDKSETLLTHYARFFAASDDEERAAALGQAETLDFSPVAPFVAAHFALVRGDQALSRRLLSEACARGLSGFALVRAKVLAALMGESGATPRQLPPVDGLDAAYAYPEVASILATGDLGPIVDHASRVLRRA